MASKIITGEELAQKIKDTIYLDGAAYSAKTLEEIKASAEDFWGFTLTPTNKCVCIDKTQMAQHGAWGSPTEDGASYNYPNMLTFWKDLYGSSTSSIVNHNEEDSRAYLIVTNLGDKQLLPESNVSFSGGTLTNFNGSWGFCYSTISASTTATTGVTITVQPKIESSGTFSKIVGNFVKNGVNASTSWSPSTSYPVYVDRHKDDDTMKWEFFITCQHNKNTHTPITTGRTMTFDGKSIGIVSTKVEDNYANYSGWTTASLKTMLSSAHTFVLNTAYNTASTPTTTAVTLSLASQKIHLNRGTGTAPFDLKITGLTFKPNSNMSIVVLDDALDYRLGSWTGCTLTTGSTASIKIPTAQIATFRGGDYWIEVPFVENYVTTNNATVNIIFHVYCDGTTIYFADSESQLVLVGPNNPSMSLPVRNNSGYDTTVAIGNYQTTEAYGSETVTGTDGIRYLYDMAMNEERITNIVRFTCSGNKPVYHISYTSLQLGTAMSSGTWINLLPYGLYNGNWSTLCNALRSKSGWGWRIGN